MAITNPIGWAKWLEDHVSNVAYNAKPEEVMKLCNSTDPVQNFETVSKCKNIMILTKAPIGAKLQLSFYHSVIGILILPDDLRYVARMCSERGIVYVVRQFVRISHYPKRSHEVGLNHIARYMQRTKDKGMISSPNTEKIRLDFSVDPNFAGLVAVEDINESLGVFGGIPIPC